MNARFYSSPRNGPFTFGASGTSSVRSICTWGALVVSALGIWFGTAHGFSNAPDSDPGLPPDPGNPVPFQLLPCIPPMPPNPGVGCLWVKEETRIQKQEPQIVLNDEEWVIAWSAYYPNGCQTDYCEGHMPPPLAVGPIQDEFEVQQSYNVSGSLQLAVETNAIAKAIAEANASVTFNGEVYNSKTRTFTVNFPTRCVPFCMVLPYKELVLIGNATVEVADWRVVTRYRLWHDPNGPPFATCDFEETTTTSCQAGDHAKIVASGGDQKKIEQIMEIGRAHV